MELKTVMIRNLEREVDMTTELNERFGGIPMSQAFIRAAKMFLTLEKENAKLSAELRELKNRYRNTRYTVEQYLTAKRKFEKMASDEYLTAKQNFEKLVPDN